MSGFPIIDLVVGLFFIFFILSIITSSIVEMIMSRLKVRNKFLAKWLYTIFDKKMMQPDGKVMMLGQAIMDHCVTTALSDDGSATSFMDAKNFVSALIEKITFNVNDPNETVIQTLDDLLVKIEKATSIDGTSLLSTELRRTFLIYGTEAKMALPVLQPNLIGAGSGPLPTAVISVNTLPQPTAKNTLDLFREKLEKWFDSSMDRVTGRMKNKYIRPYTFGIGLLVVIFLNADTIEISKYLYDHKEETKQFADKALVVARNIDTSASHDWNNHDLKLNETMAKIYNDIDTLKQVAPKEMPFGWNKKVGIGEAFASVGAHAIGWLATVAAIMLGAPFWFDLLNKIGNIRGTGAKPASSTDKKTN